MFMYEVYEIIAVFLGIIGVVIPSVGIPLAYYYKKRKLIEEHRTNNLALAYQILTKRPELTLDQVKELVVLSGGSEVAKLDDNRY